MNSALDAKEMIRLAAMGGLLHDVGKLVQRGSGKRKNHMDVGADWLEERENGWETYSFAARYHHTAPNASVRLEHCTDRRLLPIAAVVAHADNLSSSEREDVEGTKNWDKNVALRNIFDQVNLEGRGKSPSPTFFPVAPLSDGHLLFPAPRGDSSILFNYEVLEENLKAHFDESSPSQQTPGWLLRVLEKYTALVPSETLVAEEQDRFPDISLFDHLRTTAMIGVCLQQCIEEDHPEILDSPNPYRAIESSFQKTDPFLLVEGDIRGIQRYIYDVSSKGALRGLRSRSFHLELLLEETAERILSETGLPATQVLFSGGGHFLLLLPNTESIMKKLISLQKTISMDFWERDPRLSLALVWQSLSWKGLKSSDGLQDAFGELHEKLAREKAVPMADHLPGILGSSADGNGKTCRVCGARSAVLHDMKEEKEVACSACSSLYALGGRLSDAKYLWRENGDIRTSRDIDTVPQRAGRVWVLRKVRDGLKKEDGRFRPLPWAEYAFDDQLENVLDEGCIGNRKMGALRMDVDSLGLIFAGGLGASYSMSRVATLSRMLTFFFKSALPVLAARTSESRIPAIFPRRVKGAFPEDAPRRIVLIYSGGDDLFAVGAWNEIAEFALDVTDAFRKYAGGSPSMSISGGMVVLDDKAPISEGAITGGRAERAAKNHETPDGEKKNSLALFYAQSPVSVPDGDGRKTTEIRDSGAFNLTTEMPRVLRWLSVFLAGGKIAEGPRLSPAYDRAFLRRMLSLQKISDRKGPLWKPLAAYAASRSSRGGKEKELLLQLLHSEGPELEAARTAGTWIDWLMRRPSDE